MEAAPRLQMLCFEQKQSPKPAEFAYPLKKFIASFYNEDPANYVKAIHDMEQLRVEACAATKGCSGIAVLKRYYAQLRSLQTRFPMTDDGAACVAFMWSDLYSGVVFNIADVKYELSSILYNIGALHSQLGALEDRTAADGMKNACSHFQCAAWAFQHNRDTYPQPKGCDLSHDLLTFYSLVMLGQSQECILEKSLLDNRKSSISAKISAQIVEFYMKSINHLTADIKGIVGPKIYLQWKRLCEMKASYYGAVTAFHMGLGAEEDGKYGYRLAWYREAMRRFQASVQAAHDLGIDDALAFTHDVIGGKLNAAEKENDFVYHDIVPSGEALPEVKGAVLVKGMPFDPSDPEVSGPDLFASLIPMAAHEASSVYSEKKADLLRRISEKIERKNEELASYQSNLNIDKAFLTELLVKPSLPPDIIEICARFHTQKTGVSDLNAKLTKLQKMADDVDQLLSNSENEISKTRPGGATSNVLADLRAELAKYREIHIHSSQSNDTLREALKAHDTNLALLQFTPDLLLQKLPHAIEATVDDAKVFNELIRLFDKIEEMSAQRAKLHQSLRDAIRQDDITKLIVASGQEDLKNVFDKALAKHKQAIAVIEKNLEAQENILSAVTLSNANAAEVRLNLEQARQPWSQAIEGLRSSAKVFEEIEAQAAKGIEFFEKFFANVSKLSTRLRSVVQVEREQDEMRSRLQQNSGAALHRTDTAAPPAQQALKSFGKPTDSADAKTFYGTTSSTTGIKNEDVVFGSHAASSAAPKLKDYLDLMNRVKNNQNATTESKLSLAALSFQSGRPQPAGIGANEYIPQAMPGSPGISVSFSRAATATSVMGPITSLSKSGGAAGLPLNAADSFHFDAAGQHAYLNWYQYQLQQQPAPLLAAASVTVPPSSLQNPTQVNSASLLAERSPQHRLPPGAQVIGHMAMKPLSPANPVALTGAVQFPQQAPTSLQQQQQHQKVLNASAHQSSSTPLSTVHSSFTSAVTAQLPSVDTLNPAAQNALEQTALRGTTATSSLGRVASTMSSTLPVASGTCAFSIQQQQYINNAYSLNNLVYPGHGSVVGYPSAYGAYAHLYAQPFAPKTGATPAHQSSTIATNSSTSMPVTSSISSDSMMPALPSGTNSLTPPNNAKPTAGATALSEAPVQGSGLAPNTFASHPALVVEPHSQQQSLATQYTQQSDLRGHATSLAPGQVKSSLADVSLNAPHQMLAQVSYSPSQILMLQPKGDISTVPTTKTTSTVLASPITSSGYVASTGTSQAPTPNLDMRTFTANVATLPTVTNCVSSNINAVPVFSAAPLNASFASYQWSEAGSNHPQVMPTPSASTYITSGGTAPTATASYRPSGLEGRIASGYAVYASMPQHLQSHGLPLTQFQTQHQQQQTFNQQAAQMPSAQPSAVSSGTNAVTPCQQSTISPHPTSVVSVSSLTPSSESPNVRTVGQSIVSLLDQSPTGAAMDTAIAGSDGSISNSSMTNILKPTIVGFSSISQSIKSDSSVEKKGTELSPSIANAPQARNCQENERVAGKLDQPESSSTGERGSIPQKNQDCVQNDRQTSDSSNVLPTTLPATLGPETFEKSKNSDLGNPLEKHQTQEDLKNTFNRLDDMVRSLQLENRWKEYLEIQDMESRSLKVSVGRVCSMKNRFPDIMPYDYNRVVLSSAKDDYINASLISASVENEPSYIVTQAPLGGTTEDFWTMVWEQNVETILALSSSQEVSSQKYFPSEKGTSQTYGLYCVTVLSISELEEHLFSERLLSISGPKNPTKKNVILLHLTEWTRDADRLLSLTNRLLYLYRNQKNLKSPILIQCLGGCGRSGVLTFCLRWLSHLRLGRVPSDPSSLLPSLVRARKLLLLEKDQLRTCYEFALASTRAALVERGIVPPISSAATSVTDIDRVEDKQRKGETLSAEERILQDLMDDFRSKSKITKASFENPRGLESNGFNGDPNDPLSQLDPLWSLKRHG